MQIYQMQINHFTTPIGYDYQDPSFTYKVKDNSGTELIAHSLEISTDYNFTQLIYNTNKRKTTQGLFTNINLNLKPRTRYWWRITAWNDLGENTSNISWFETGKLDEEWSGSWITPVNKNISACNVIYNFTCSKKIKQARLYICGLGLYEVTINNQKVGKEFLTPGYNNYSSWIQYQSYDVSQFIKNNNKISVILGKGWYKGRFGFNGGSENIFGDRLALLAELRILYADSTESIITSNSQWKGVKGYIEENSIYYGEDYNALADGDTNIPIKTFSGPKSKLKERLSAPVAIEDKLSVKQILTEPELILDMGQNMVGWICFKNVLPKGLTIKLEFAETLIHGKFYRDNLREARSAFVYTSDGISKWIRPHFTFYGFRFVRITGWPQNIKLNLKNFIGLVLTTQMKRTGYFITNNKKVNRLYENILWSQKGNFVDVPTDCPQRDERMGWTGDAQIFSKTALYNTDAYAFYQKYGYDMKTVQQTHNGAPTMMIPDVPTNLSSSSVANGIWGDAAVIIPWNTYLASGDPRILRQQFVSMKGWLNYVKTRPTEKGLWAKDFQFGDWLALDGDDPQSPIGGTEAKFVANVYYLNSLRIASKTAQIIGEKDIFKARMIDLKQSIRNEYFTPNGRFAQDTQTGYLLALYFDLLKPKEKQDTVDRLKKRLEKDDYHLKTGFVGTPLLNSVLSDFDLDDIAYTLLLNDDYPSWLYEVKMGATTIWERWNSILPTGDINPEGMNSLNHYAYGAIGSWFYEYVLGIKPLKPGFRLVKIAPHLHWSLPSFKGSYITPQGEIKIAVKINNNNIIDLKLTVPFNTKAYLHLPFYNKEKQQQFSHYKWSNHDIVLSHGNYDFQYSSSVALNKSFTSRTTLNDILQEPLTMVRFKSQFKGRKILSDSIIRHHSQDTLDTLVKLKLISNSEMVKFLDNINKLGEKEYE